MSGEGVIEMPYTQEQLLEKSDEELNRISAEVCNGWIRYINDSKEHGDTWHLDNDTAPFGKILPLNYWQPCFPTRQGESQCWKLMVKFKINPWEVIAKNTFHRYLSRDPNPEDNELDPQKAVVIASVLAAQQNKTEDE